MTALPKFNATLPPETRDQLIKAREEGLTEFGAYVIALRENRWPYRSIGDVFSVSRVAAQAWYNRAKNNPDAVELADTLQDIPELPVDARGSQVKVIRLVPDVPPLERERLHELTLQARDVGRWTPVDAPSRKAAADLEALIYSYIVVRKIPAAVVARHAGVTRRAVVQRLEKQKQKLQNTSKVAA